MMPVREQLPSFGVRPEQMVEPMSPQELEAASAAAERILARLKPVAADAEAALARSDNPHTRRARRHALWLGIHLNEALKAFQDGYRVRARAKLAAAQDYAQSVGEPGMLAELQRIMGVSCG